ncbi:siderophore-interacting protein [Actinomycetaceae bacterium L2_0104]
MDIFPVRVREIADLTPHMRRFTVTGDSLDRYGDTGYDQRIKVVFPSEITGLETMPTGADWYPKWRELDPETRPPFRTYTTRAVRREVLEVDVDMVAHDVQGPASRWIRDAAVGDELMIVAPSIDDEPPHLGIDFVPPAEVGRYLLVGDETAAPAIAVILEQLPRDAQGVVVVEFPNESDASYIPEHPGFVRYIGGRETGQRHAYLERVVRDILPDLCPVGRGGEVEEVDIDEDLLWEVPRTKKGGAALKSAPLYAWLAGEAGVIKSLRRFLVSEHGVDRRAVAFMGYWRLGRAEGN